MLPKILVFSRPKLYSFFDSKYPSVGAATLVIISKDLSFKMELIEEFNSYLLRLILKKFLFSNSEISSDK